VIESEIKGSMEKLRQKAKIPGFRPGKAPISLIEKRFGKEVESEVLEKIIPEQLGSAIREAALTPVTMPALDEEFQFTRNNPITLSVTR
jgi:trigger factor